MCYVYCSHINLFEMTNVYLSRTLICHWHDMINLFVRCKHQGKALNSVSVVISAWLNYFQRSIIVDAINMLDTG